MPKYFGCLSLESKIFDCQKKILTNAMTSYHHNDVKNWKSLLFWFYPNFRDFTLRLNGHNLWPIIFLQKYIDLFKIGSIRWGSEIQEMLPKPINKSFPRWIWPENTIGTINFVPSCTNYVICGQLLYIRSKIEKSVFDTWLDIGLILKQMTFWMH